MTAYYNENDPRVAAWMRDLIADDVIAPGVVDERSIEDVRPDDLKGFRQCHFFAGVGGWSYALRLAGWPDERPIWTGSCPCQPFSCAGKGKGIDDSRHLWPAFRWLIAQCGPSICFGEQVASADGREWLAGVRLDLEAMGYEVGAADLCAAGVGSPHIRQRLFWVGNTEGERIWNQAKQDGGDNARGTSPAGRLGDATGGGCGERGDAARSRRGGHTERTGGPRPRRVADVCGEGLARRAEQPTREERQAAQRGGRDGVDWTRSLWQPCRDGKYRRVPAQPEIQRVADGLSAGVVAGGLAVDPELFPLAEGEPGRVTLLRGYGNAIVPQVAAQFVRAYEDTIQ